MAVEGRAGIKANGTHAQLEGDPVLVLDWLLPIVKRKIHIGERSGQTLDQFPILRSHLLTHRRLLLILQKVMRIKQLAVVVSLGLIVHSSLGLDEVTSDLSISLRNMVRKEQLWNLLLRSSLWHHLRSKLLVHLHVWLQAKTIVHSWRTWLLRTTELWNEVATRLRLSHHLLTCLESKLLLDLLQLELLEKQLLLLFHELLLFEDLLNVELPLHELVVSDQLVLNVHWELAHLAIKIGQHRSLLLWLWLPEGKQWMLRLRLLHDHLHGSLGHANLLRMRIVKHLGIWLLMNLLTLVRHVKTHVLL